MDILFVWTNHFDRPQGLFTYGNKNIYECIEIRYSDLITFDDQMVSWIFCNCILQVFQQTKYIQILRWLDFYIFTVNVSTFVLNKNKHCYNLYVQFL